MFLYGQSTCYFHELQGKHLQKKNMKRYLLFVSLIRSQVSMAIQFEHVKWVTFMKTIIATKYANWCIEKIDGKNPNCWEIP